MKCGLVWDAASPLHVLIVSMHLKLRVGDGIVFSPLHPSKTNPVSSCCLLHELTVLELHSKKDPNSRNLCAVESCGECHSSCSLGLGFQG